MHLSRFHKRWSPQPNIPEGSQPEVLRPEDSLETVLHEQKNILREVRRAGVPSLLLSYEKAVTTPESFLDKLLFFIGTNPKEANREKLKALISPITLDIP